MVPNLHRLVIPALGIAMVLLPATVGAQKTEDEAGSITAVDANSGLVTVAAAGQPAQRYQFVVAQAVLRTRLRPGQPVTLNLRTATGQLGGQTLRMQSVLTQLAVAPKVRIGQLCAAQQAALNAALDGVPPGTPTALWTCVAELVAGRNRYWCRCTPQFSF